MTTLVRFREPFRSVAGATEEFDRIVSAFLDTPARLAARTNQAWAPPLDVWETEGELVYAFDLPGVPQDAITVDLDGGALTVSGSRERREAVEGERFFRYERRFGQFSRSVSLPEGAAEADIAAHYADGVLEVRVRKPEHAKPRRIPVLKTLARES